jgi:hypothetical protein
MDVQLLPPRAFVAAPMQVPMIRTTKRHGVFVADLAPERKLQMVRIRGTGAAGETRLRADEPEVIPVWPELMLNPNRRRN